MNDITYKNVDGSEIEVSGTIKWMNAVSGYGFVIWGRAKNDAMLHMTVLKQGGYMAAGQGDKIKCLINRDSNGLYVSRVIELKRAKEVNANDLINMKDYALTDIPFRMRATVKFYDPKLGYGFAKSENGDDIFVGAKSLRRLKLGALRANQNIYVSAVLTKGKLVAETISF